MSSQLATPSRLASDGPRVQALSDWLVQQGLRGTRLEDLLAGFCEGLRALGVPLWRGHVSMRTLHPSFEALTFVWHPNTGIVRQQRAYTDGISDEWMRSPFHHMFQTDNFILRRRLSGPEARVDFALLEEIRDQGATDYIARIMPFGDEGIIDGRTGVLASWATDRPEGFTDTEIAVLDRLQQRLALTLKTILGLEITHNIVDAYIGPKTGRRILRGEIHRGVVDTIHAVIFYADLRGFTALTDRVPRDELVPMLDDYLECIVRPVIDHGGEVLKYLGDGLLATFDLSAAGQDSICRVALDSAVGALRLTDALNRARAAAGKPLTDLDVALHLGDVLYGNVGALDRLDFTVIGPAVNEASRIEGLCDQIGRRLLISDSFAGAATQCTSRLVSVGRHRLRGLERQQEIYSMDIPEAMARLAIGIRGRG